MKAKKKESERGEVRGATGDEKPYGIVGGSRRRHRHRRRRRLCRRENNECMRGARGEMGLVVPRERQRVAHTCSLATSRGAPLHLLYLHHRRFPQPPCSPPFCTPWERSLSPPRRSPLPPRSLLRPASPFFLPFAIFFFTLPHHHPRGKTPLNIYATAHVLRMLYFSSHSV